jgi:hypothetical protein
MAFKEREQCSIAEGCTTSSASLWRVPAHACRGADRAPPACAHRRTKPFPPVSWEKWLRHCAVLGTACAVWLGVLSALSHAQTDKSRTMQQENTMTPSAATQRSRGQAADKDAMRPFQVRIPEEALVDLRRRIAATRWPDKETGVEWPWNRYVLQRIFVHMRSSRICAASGQEAR